MIIAPVKIQSSVELVRPNLQFVHTRLTKFLSASNQIVKDLDCPPLPPEGRKNDQPASKLARFSLHFFEKLRKKRNKAITASPLNHKNFVLEKELTGGCYHRRAKRLGIENPAFAATVCYLPCSLPDTSDSDITRVTLSRFSANCNFFARFRRQETACCHREIITVRLPDRRSLRSRLRLRQHLAD